MLQGLFRSVGLGWSERSDAAHARQNARAYAQHGCARTLPAYPSPGSKSALAKVCRASLAPRRRVYCCAVSGQCASSSYPISVHSTARDGCL